MSKIIKKAEKINQMERHMEKVMRIKYIVGGFY